MIAVLALTFGAMIGFTVGALYEALRAYGSRDLLSHRDDAIVALGEARATIARLEVRLASREAEIARRWAA